jgi:HTH-type transcriptional regulator, glycine betaine synthesis regulator
VRKYVIRVRICSISSRESPDSSLVFYKKIYKRLVSVVCKFVNIRDCSYRSRHEALKNKAIATSSPDPATTDPVGLSELEREFILFFVQIAQSLSLPRSIGEIFGFLFTAEAPLPFEEVVARLGISKGAASQGLRFLVKHGAVSLHYIPRDRRTFYIAETSMRKLFGNALTESLRPHLESNRRLIDNLETAVADSQAAAPGSSTLAQRVTSLRTWNEKALQLLPLLETLFALPSPHSLLERLRRKSEAANSSPSD